MIVYRVGRTKWGKDKAGQGARLHGGRWNHIRIRCLYTSASRALSLLEYTVNVNIDDIPRSLSITSYNITGMRILEMEPAQLPGNWKDSPAPSSTKDFGSAYLQDHSISVIKIPSSVIPEEFNYLINPLGDQIGLVKIIDVRDFVYDIRIKN